MTRKVKKVLNTAGKLADNAFLSGVVTNKTEDGGKFPAGRFDWVRFIGQLFDWKMLLLIALLLGWIDVKQVKELFELFLGM